MEFVCGRTWWHNAIPYHQHTPEAALLRETAYGGPFDFLVHASFGVVAEKEFKNDAVCVLLSANCSYSCSVVGTHNVECGRCCCCCQYLQTETFAYDGSGAGDSNGDS